MAIIPTYQQRVSPTTVQEPEVRLPEPVRGAFGGDVARATQGLGNTIGNVAGLLQRRAEQKRKEEQDKIESDAYISYQTAKQDILMNDQMGSVSVDGQPQERQIGVLNRSLSSAQGATQDFQQRMDAYVRDSLDKVKDPSTRQRLARRFAQDVLTTRETVIKHEVKQDRENKLNAHSSSIKQAQDAAYSARTPGELVIQVENAKIAQESINRVMGYDEETAKSKVQDISRSTVEKAILGSLELDPTGATSKTLLESQKDSISSEVYDKNLDIVNKSIEKRNKEFEAEQRRVVRDTTDGLYDAFFAGSLTLAQIEEASPVIGGKTAAALRNRILTEQNRAIRDITTDNQSAEEYVMLVDSMINNKTDAFNFKEFLVGAFDDGVIDRDEARILSGVKSKLQDLRFNRSSGFFVNRMKDLKSWFGRNNPSDADLIEASKNLIMFNKNVDKNLEEIDEQYLSIIKEEQRKINPNAGLYQMGQIIVTDTGSWEVVGEDEDGEPLVVRKK